jgi:hypothetical protein
LEPSAVTPRWALPGQRGDSHLQDHATWGVGKEAARSRNRWYIAWSAHRHRSALALQTAPSAANDQCRGQQQQSRLRLMTPFLPTPRSGRTSWPVSRRILCSSRSRTRADGLCSPARPTGTLRGSVGHDILRTDGNHLYRPLWTLCSSLVPDPSTQHCPRDSTSVTTAARTPTEATNSSSRTLAVPATVVMRTPSIS